MTEPFQPHQIVCFANGQTHLYGEMIQLLASRGQCWVRPLLLADYDQAFTADGWIPYPLEWVDLRGSSDIVYPLDCFRPAYDQELLPLLLLMGQEDEEMVFAQRSPNQSKLWQFLRQWQAEAH